MQRRQRNEVVQELQSLYSNLVVLGDFQSKAKCENIVAFHGAFTNAEEMSMSLVLEYMDRGTLQDYVKHRVKLNESEIARIASDTLKGIAFLHERRQIHRDIKPGNILVNSRGYVKISDFGISRKFDSMNLSHAETFTGE
jgi:mitogen-activated protein kinase kinase 3